MKRKAQNAKLKIEAVRFKVGSLNLFTFKLKLWALTFAL